MYRIPAQSFFESIAVVFILSDTFKLLYMVFFLSLSPFYLSLKSPFCGSKKHLVLIFKISFQCKNKVNCYFRTFLSNISKLVFLWQTTCVITYAAINSPSKNSTSKKFYYPSKEFFKWIRKDIKTIHRKCFVPKIWSINEWTKYWWATYLLFSDLLIN